MSAVYLESSAVLAWLFGEASAAEVIDAVDEAEVIVTSALTFAEAARAIRRAVAERRVKEAAARRLRGLLARQRPGWVTMSVTQDVLARAGRAFPVEPVRTLDAIHLATALEFTEALPELTMLVFDRRIGANATALGLASV